MRHTHLIFISVAIGFFETAQILLLIPFLSVVNSIINNGDMNATLVNVAKLLDLSILALSTLITVIGIITSNLIKVVLYYKRLQLLHSTRKNLILDLIGAADNKLHYTQSKSKHEELRSLFTTEVENYVTTYLLPKTNLAQATTAMIFTLILIVSVLPFNILIGVAFIVVIYIFTSIYFNKVNQRLGLDRVRLNDQRLILANIISSTNYETTLLNLRNNLTQDAERLLAQYSDVIAKAHFVSQFPKFIIEAVSLTLVSILIYTFYNSDSQSDALYVLGATGLAFYKAIPSIQSVYQNLATLKFGQPIARTIAKFRVTPADYCERVSKPITEIHVSDLTLFADNTKLSSDINITFKTGDRVAIIGNSGVGKTTFLHTLLGINNDYQGKVRINGRDIKIIDIKSYMSKISYVPNKSINLSDFSRLDPTHGKAEHYSTGQMQRSIIEVALKEVPDVLFLDEFTSSQDLSNQDILMKQILSLKDTIVISVVHRTETLKYYDYVYELTHHGLKLIRENGFLYDDR